MSIYYIRKTGDDTKDGQSPTNAWETLAKAAAELTAGDTVYIGGGNYSSETLDPSNSGSSGNRIEFISDRTGIYTGDPGHVIAEYLTCAKDYITFDGFTVVGISGWAVDLGGNYNILKNCIVDYSSRFYQSDEAKAYNNIFGRSARSPDASIYLRLIDGQTIYLYNNTIIGTREAGSSNASCIAGPYSPNEAHFDVYVKNNLFIEYEGTLADYLICYYVQYKNDWNTRFHLDNNFYKYTNGKFMYVDVWMEGGDNEFDNLTELQNGTPELNAKEPNSKEGDPKVYGSFNGDFHGFTDIHLKVDSSCINSGANVGVFDDIDGDLRTDTPDIGCDECKGKLKKHFVSSESDLADLVLGVIPGDEVYIKAGDYSSKSLVLYWQGGTEDDEVLVYGDRFGEYNDSEGAVKVGKFSWKVIGHHPPAYTTFRGLNFVDSGQESVLIEGYYSIDPEQVNPHHIIFDRCYCQGVKFDRAVSCKFLCGYSKIDSATKKALHLHRTAFTEVYFSLFDNASSTVDSSTLYVRDDQSAGLGPKFKDNIVINTGGQYLIEAESSNFFSSDFFDYNCYQSNPDKFGFKTGGVIIETLEEWKGTWTTPQDSHSFDGDPYLDSSKEKIQKGSPCVDAGISLSEIEEDYYRNKRSSPPDMGPYEYIPYSATRTYIYNSRDYDLDGYVPKKMFFDSVYGVDGTDRLRIFVSFNQKESWLTLVNTDEGIDYTKQVVNIPEGMRGSYVNVLIEVDLLGENIVFGEDAEVREEVIFGYIEGGQGSIVRVIDSSNGSFIRDIIVDQFGFFTGKLAPGCYDIQFIGLPQGEVITININGYILRDVREFKKLILGHSDTLGRWGITSFQVSRYIERCAILNYLRNVQWGKYLVFDTFVDETKRLDPEPTLYPLLCGHGKVYISKTYSDYYSIVLE